MIKNYLRLKMEWNGTEERIFVRNWVRSNKNLWNTLGRN